MHLSFVRYSDLARIVGAVPPMPWVRCIVGVPRSGMIPATMLSVQMNRPLGMVGSNEAHGGFRSDVDGLPDHGVLLVDDSVNTGRAMRDAKQKLVDQGVKEEAIKTYAVVASPEAVNEVDYHSVVLPRPRIFEWNLFGNDLARYVMFDMDGVMCFDPEAFDDDGEEYHRSIREATPRFLPTRPVHSIVTNRIERWRQTTEEWLSLHGVKYGELVMQQYDTAAARRRHSHPAQFKAEHYGDSDAWLYVESHDQIGKQIADLSHRPVFTIQSGALFKGGKK